MQPLRKKEAKGTTSLFYTCKMQKKNGLGFKSGNNTYAAHIYNTTDQ
jgi:hypothetical protein